MTRNIVLHVAYEGTHFHGYQIQPQQRTVQSTLETALSRLLQEQITVICAGRTDAGVHALAQVVNFHTAHTLPVNRFVPALRSMLPADVAVWQAWEFSLDFHARFSAAARHYRYYLQPQAAPNPFLDKRVWLCPWHLDTSLFQQTWRSLVGRHNFSAFCKSGSYRKNHWIQVLMANCQYDKGLLVADIMADSFLYNMVRNLVGTVSEIARGRLSPEHLSRLLQHPDRQQVGVTAPPQGLYLYNVVYPPEFKLYLHTAQVAGSLLPMLC